MALVSLCTQACTRLQSEGQDHTDPDFRDAVGIVVVAVASGEGLYARFHAGHITVTSHGLYYKMAKCDDSSVL
jgi:hypothetical protein